MQKYKKIILKNNSLSLQKNENTRQQHNDYSNSLQHRIAIFPGVSDMVDGWVARRIFEFLLPLQRFKKDIL